MAHNTLTRRGRPAPDASSRRQQTHCSWIYGFMDLWIEKKICRTVQCSHGHPRTALVPFPPTRGICCHCLSHSTEQDYLLCCTPCSLDSDHVLPQGLFSLTRVRSISKSISRYLTSQVLLVSSPLSPTENCSPPLHVRTMVQ